MYNLYECDKSRELAEKKKDLKSYFEDRSRGKRKRDKSLQNKINTYANLRAYELHRTNDEWKDIRNCVNESFNQFIKHLDISEEEFRKSFFGNYLQRLFEIVIANFMRKKLGLIEKESRIRVNNGSKGNKDHFLADYQFNKDNFLEVTTRNASEMDKFDGLLPNFDNYLELWEVLKEAYKARPWVGEKDLSLLHLHIDQIVPYLEKGKRKISRRKILLIKNWIYYNRQACLDYRDIVPDELLKKLKSIDFPISSQSCDRTHIEKFERFFIKALAQKIVDKTKNCHYGSVDSLTLAISFAGLPNWSAFPSIGGMDYFLNKLVREFLPQELNLQISHQKNEEQKKIKSNLGKLYAILIDTTWYNWFPSFVTEKGWAKFPPCGNTYGVIYNADFSGRIGHDENIFDSLVDEKNRIEMPLSLSLELIEEAE